MSRAQINRIAKLEPRPPLTEGAPNIVTVQYGETIDAALAGFAARHASQIRARHGVIVVPARISSPEEQAEFTVGFYARQNALIATARSAPQKEAPNV